MVEGDQERQHHRGIKMIKTSYGKSHHNINPIEVPLRELKKGVMFLLPKEGIFLTINEGFPQLDPFTDCVSLTTGQKRPVSKSCMVFRMRRVLLIDDDGTEEITQDDLGLGVMKPKPEDKQDAVIKK